MQYPNNPGYRTTDTSKAAAVSMARSAPTIQMAVRDCLATYGPLASFQIVEKTGIGYRSVQPRTSELRLDGVIEDSGRRLDDPETGRAAIVWQLVEKQAA